MFLQGFRATRFLGIWPRLRGQTGPAPDTSEHGPEPGSDGQLGLVNFTAATDVKPSRLSFLNLFRGFEASGPP